MSPDTQGSRLARLEQRSDDHEHDIKRVEDRHEQDMRAFGGEVGKSAVLEVRLYAVIEKVDGLLARLDRAEQRAGEARRWRVSTYIAAGGLFLTLLTVAVSVMALVLAQ